MKVLVTGAQGFVGEYLVPALKAKGFEVFDTRFDVLDPLACAKAMQGMDFVYHLAAKVAVKPRDRKRATWINVEGTRNVLNAAIAAKVKRFLHVSSVATVGVTPDGRVLTEAESKHLFADRNFPNFDSKIDSENLVIEAAKQKKIDAVIVNPSMIFGAGDAKKAARKGNLMAAKGKLPFYTLGGMSMVAVEDVVSGMIAAMEKGRMGERYILSGDNIHFKDVLSEYAKLAGVSPPKRPASTPVLKGIASLLETLGFNSELTLESASAATSFHWFDHAKATRELDFHPRPWTSAVENSFRFMKENGYLK